MSPTIIDIRIYIYLKDTETLSYDSRTSAATHAHLYTYFLHKDETRTFTAEDDVTFFTSYNSCTCTEDSTHFLYLFSAHCFLCISSPQKCQYHRYRNHHMPPCQALPISPQALSRRVDRRAYPRTRTHFVHHAQNHHCHLGNVPVLIDGLSVGRYPLNSQNSRLNASLTISALHFYHKPAISVTVLLPFPIQFPSSSARDLQQMLAWRDNGLLVVIPRGSDYDSFLLRSALLRGADIVSNRCFENVLRSQRDLADRASLSVYLRTHLIPFAFVLGLFVANPDRRAIAQGLHAPRAVKEC